MQVPGKKTVFKPPFVARDDNEELRNREHQRSSIEMTNVQDADRSYLDEVIASIKLVLPDWVPPARK